jgi:hypothetical protein
VDRPAGRPAGPRGGGGPGPPGDGRARGPRPPGPAGACRTSSTPGRCSSPGRGTLAALLALSQPFFYYPDVDTHADLVEALDETPSLALDPRPYQALTGAWTRGIGDARVPFPYSPAFHVIAWPLAHALGAVAAIKTVAVLALGLTLLLAHALARSVGLTGTAALAAQAVVAVLPVTASRLTLALYPALLAQALELALVVFLSRRLPPRFLAAVFVLLAVVQLAYTARC